MIWILNEEIKQKMILKKTKNSVFAKTVENVRKCRYIKIIKTEARRNYLVSEPNYQLTIFVWKSISNKKERNKILMNKPVYLGFSILELSKTAMYELC